MILRVALSLAFLLASAVGVSHAQVPVFFTGVKVFDGERVVPSTNVLVVDGRIAAIGDEVSAPSVARTIDGAGKTLLPGLIDAHTHAFSEEQLRRAVRFGVTTELDMLSIPALAAGFREQQRRGEATQRADFFSAGAAVTVAGGHGTQFGPNTPVLESADHADEFVAARVAEGSDYLKLIHEDGSTFGKPYPTLDRKSFVAAVRAAHARDRLAVAHVSTARGAEMAIGSGVDGLVHLFADEKASEELVALAAERGVFVVPTMAVVANVAGTNLSARLLSRDAYAPLLDKAGRDALSAEVPYFQSNGVWAALRYSVRELHQAGVPILVGSDAPNPGTDHGLSVHHELRLLVDLGFDPIEALCSATSATADAFRLTDRGRIAVGRRADLLLVEGDPTQDLDALARIQGTWKRGIAIGRPDPTETRAESPAQPATPSRLVSNFNADRVKAEFGFGWSPSTDKFLGGTSTCDIELARTGGVDGGCLVVSGEVRQGKMAYAGVMFSPGAYPMAAADLSAHDGVSFAIRGQGEWDVLVFTKKRGYQPSIQTVEASGDWTRRHFTWADFDKTDGGDVIGVWFGATSPGAFRFELDNVRLGPADDTK